VLFTKTLKYTYEENYYKGQLIRSSGSAALNYGEATGSTTTKDFIHKMSIVRKELKESKIDLNVLSYISAGNKVKRDWLIEESTELTKITNTMILNKSSKK